MTNSYDATTSATYHYQTSQLTHTTQPNEFIGVGKGLFGDVVVKVTVNVENIEVIEEYETVGIGDLAIQKIPQEILKAGHWDVDVVSSATVTSDAIKQGVQQALQQALSTFEDEQTSNTPSSISKTVEPVKNPAFHLSKSMRLRG